MAAAVCGLLAGASSFAAITDWLYDLVEAAQSGSDPPWCSACTAVLRLLTRLDADQLTAVLAGWLQFRTIPAPQRSHRYPKGDRDRQRQDTTWAHLVDGRRVHLLSALDTSTGIVLATIDAKSIETLPSTCRQPRRHGRTGQSI